MSKKYILTEKRAFYNQLYASVATGLGGTAMMYAHSFPTFGVPSMERDPDFAITPQQSALMGSIVPIVSIPGNFMAGMMVDAIGRRKTIIAGGCIFLIALPLLALSTSIGPALLSRVLCGLGDSLLMLGIMIYNTEVVEPRHRDRLSCVTAVMFNVGMLSAFVVGSQLEWRGQAWVGLFVVIPMLIMLIALPQTPLFLVKKGKISDALIAITWYRSHSQAEYELKSLEKADAQRDDASVIGIRDLLSLPYLKPLMAAFILLVAQQLSGITAITQNAVKMFELMGTSFAPAFSTILIAVVNILATVAGAEIQVRYDRKPTLLRTTYLLVALQVLLGVFFWARQSEDDSIKAWAESSSGFALTAVLLYFVTFSVGLGPITWMYISEGFPTKIRGMGTAAVVTLHLMAFSGVLSVFQPLVSAVGYDGAFLLFALCTSVLVAAGHGLMIETRGKSVSDIDCYYNSLEESTEKLKIK